MMTVIQKLIIMTRHFGTVYNNRQNLMISIILYTLNGMFSTAISCYEDFSMCKHSTKFSCD